MNKTAAERLAIGVMKIKNELQELQKEAQDLRERNETLEKRARAEEILLEAQGKPSKLNAATISDFLTKRARLEVESYGELEKIATAIQFIEDSDGLTLSDYNDGSDSGDFTQWLQNINDGDR